VIEECRAFYLFLKRAFDLPQADECLALLGDEAIAKLETALGNAAESNGSSTKH
jgi:hypothetical protein